MYALVDVNSPDAREKVCLWRARCRKEGVPSVVIATDEQKIWVEISRPGKPVFSTADVQEFSNHPILNIRNASWYGTTIGLELQDTPSPETIFRVVDSILRSQASEERRAGQSVGVFSLSGQYDYVRSTSLSQGPPVAVLLDPQEYQVARAALLFLQETEPIFVWPVSRSREKWPLDNLQLQLPELKKRTIQNWSLKAGDYRWQDRFGEGIRIVEPAPNQKELSSIPIALSRPGIFEDQALVWVEHKSIRGLLLLQKRDNNWTVTENSHDEDWFACHFEPPGPPPKDDWTQKWRRYPIGYPASSAEFQKPLELEKSNEFFRSLVAGKGDSSLLEREHIPITQGESLSLLNIIALAKEKGELFYDSENSPINEILSELGHKVLLLDQSSTPGFFKFLAFLSQTCPIQNSGEVWVQEIKPNPSESQSLSLLRAIFERAGLSHLKIGAKSWGPIAFQLPRDELARTDVENAFAKRGKVLVPSGQLASFAEQSFLVMSSLCKWGDRSGEWTDKLWHATGVELARNGLQSFSSPANEIT